MIFKFSLLKHFGKQSLALTALFFSLVSPGLSGGVKITSFGHSSLFIRGGGYSVLINPFKAVGCAEGLTEPNVSADVILASSELADEGYRKSKGTFFVKPGSYLIKGLKLEGFPAYHDRFQGKRFGPATLWQWNQAGLNFAHLGGSAGPVRIEEKLFIGQPDVLFIAVGGGSKVYNAREAASIVKDLNPKIVIPVQYVRGNSPSNCDQSGIQPFLDEMKGVEYKNVGKTIKVRRKNSQPMLIKLMP